MENKLGFDNVLIYGLGAIGGSIGLKLKSLGLAKNVYGVSRSQSSINEAIKKAAIDEGSIDFHSLVPFADLIIFSVPPLKVFTLLKELAPSLKKGAFLTDVSSVKGQGYLEINDFVNSLNITKNLDLKYIGSHPMAGTEKKGIENSFLGMLDSSVILITPFDGTFQVDIGKLRDFWKILGCYSKVVSVANHDLFTAATSHFPHILAGFLTRSVHQQFLADSSVLKAIGSSFRDMVRVADSDPELWTEIISLNSENILEIINNYKLEIIKFEEILRKKDEAEILNFFRINKEKRKELIG